MFWLIIEILEPMEESFHCAFVLKSISQGQEISSTSLCDSVLVMMMCSF